MSGPRERIRCERCGRTISRRKTGPGPRVIMAHKCPHGRTCVAPAWSRMKPSCGACEAAAVVAGAPLPPSPTVDELVAAGLVKRGIQ